MSIHFFGESDGTISGIALDDHDDKEHVIEIFVNRGRVHLRIQLDGEERETTLLLTDGQAVALANAAKNAAEYCGLSTG